MTLAPQPARPQPRILVYFCHECRGENAASLALDIASAEASITTVHFSCAREVGPAELAKAFREGADGVLICGCLVRNCGRSLDDLTVLRHVYRNQVVMKKLGLETERLREEWILQGTTDDLGTILNDFSRQLKQLGPIAVPGLGSDQALREDQAEA